MKTKWKPEKFELHYQNFIYKACAAELTEKETTALHGGSVEQTKKVAVTFPECFRCGKVNYSSDSCFFRNSKCHGCQKVGHDLKKCPEKTGKEQRPESGKKSGRQSQNRGKKKKRQKVRWSKKIWNPSNQWKEAIGPCLQSQIPVENVKRSSCQ